MTAPLQGLIQWLYNHKGYTQLATELRNAPEERTDKRLTYTLPATVRAPLLTALSQDLRKPFLIITATADESQKLQQALNLWTDNPEHTLTFPEPSALFYEHAPWTPETITDRLHVLSTLFLNRTGAIAPAQPLVIISSVRALMHRTLPYRQFRRVAKEIKIGAKEPLGGLARHCSGIGYEAVSVVEVPGQYSRRGGILDIYPPQATAPYRIEYFGDEIDVIRTFDPSTQRSTGRSEKFWLLPVREALPLDGERVRDTLEYWLEEEIAPEVHATIDKEAEALAAGVPFPTLEFYIPFLYQERGLLINYLPSDTHIIFYNNATLKSTWENLQTEAERRYQQAQEVLSYLEDMPAPYVPWEHWVEMLGRHTILALQPGAEGAVENTITTIPHFAGKLSEALGRIRQWVNLGDQVVVASRQAARMAELWQDFTPPPVLKALPTPPEGLITFVHSAVPGGWQLISPDQQGPRQHFITDEELFGWRPPEPRRRPRRRVSTPEFAFSDLQPGDKVVHEDYGIGIFQGLVMRSIDDIEREYLHLEYANGDQLYVPIHQADRLTRYVGAEGVTTELSHLNSNVWTATKARAQQAAAELAGELLELYASRQIVSGYAFAPDTPWQQELEAAFPYVETEDQIRAIQAVKEDMEKPRPMDRLICGDAGYGKTEVALRAAFKSVLDGKQVAMLVPTTVLAQQHYATFRERLAPFPVSVELLSRFRTTAEQGQVLQGMRKGQVDIVIGTHRLLQKDIEFKDLGLLIIDEEQRFGVSHKEHFKQLRTEVDVLTLTATPIPRTLYMALTGVRDISIIETPPQERLPVTNYVGPNDSDITRRAILRELKRGGQVFYVHNRVETIYSVAARLRELVPEAAIAVAHGQMPERQLAKVMDRFTQGEVNVLLATTIIESGLDFPNANTLIIERADHFGLAQLYQLRGRVGRGIRRGYAYFFHGRHIKEEGQLRLQTLQESSGTGGGFSIALRDLEMRGAGELLGSQQHGQIAAIGFTLYTRMLTQAVEQLKAQRDGKPKPPAPIGAITIELPLKVGLSPEYVPDEKLRLQLYRRFAELTSEQEITQLQEELKDRFGPFPQATENLLYQLRLKVLARDSHIPAIVVESGQIALRPPWLKHFDPLEIAKLRRQLAEQLGEQARVGRREIWLQLSWDTKRWQENLRSTLEILRQWWNEIPNIA